MSIWKGSGTVLSLLTAIGIANLFGAGAGTDAYFFARKLIANIAVGFERAFQLIQVPPIVQHAHREGIASLQRHLRRRGWQTLAATLAFSALGFLFAPRLVAFLAPGFEAEQVALCTTYLRILILTLPLSALTGIGGAVMNAFRIFSLPAMARIIPRLCVVLVLFLGPASMGLSWLASAVLAGTLVMGLLFLRALRRAFRAMSDWKVMSTGSAAGPVYTKRRVVAMVIAQLHMIGASWIDMAFASLAGIGSIATLEFGQRLTNILPGVASNSVTSVYYSEFAHSFSAGDRDRFHRVLRDALRMTLFLSAPLAALVLALSDPVVTLVLQHGAFSERAAETTRTIMLVLAILLPVNAMLSATVSAIFADPGHPHLTIIGSSTAIAIAIRIAVTAALTRSLGVVAVPVGSLVSMSALFAICFVWQSRVSGFILGRTDLRPFGSILLAALACGLIARLCHVAIAPIDGSKLALAGVLLVSGGLAASGYLLVSMLLNVEEARLLGRRLWCKRSRET